MNREWLLLPLLAVGQTCGFVVIINMVHALGLRGRLMDGIKAVLLATLLAITTAVLWLTLHRPWTAWPWLVQGYALVCLLLAVVALPASTLARVCRRNPSGISERSEEINLAQIHGAGSLIGPGRHAWMFHLPGNESFRLRRREWEVALEGLPIAWDGLSLVQLSDLHFAPSFTPRFFEAVVDEAGAWDADLLLFTGDLVDDDSALDWIVPVLSRVRGQRGTYAILGNHDYDHHPQQIRQALVRAGYTDLEGRWATLDIGGRTLALGGTSAPWGPALDPSAMPEADFRILLSHSPDLLNRAARWGIDLMLSGHNHGGQIRLPGIGPVFMPSLYSRRFDRDFFRSGRTLLHVSQGVAGKHPIRYGCVPEISRVVLRAAQPRRQGYDSDERVDDTILASPG